VLKFEKGVEGEGQGWERNTRQNAYLGETIAIVPCPHSRWGGDRKGQKWRVGDHLERKFILGCVQFRRVKLPIRLQGWGPYITLETENRGGVKGKKLAGVPVRHMLMLGKIHAQGLLTDLQQLIETEGEQGKKGGRSFGGVEPSETEVNLLNACKMSCLLSSLGLSEVMQTLARWFVQSHAP